METVNKISIPSSPWSTSGFAIRPCRTRSSRIVWLFSLLLGIFSFTPILLSAEQLHPTESQVKAAYLYNFGKFVRWQTDQTAGPQALEICILGKDPFGAILDSTVSGESIDGRKIAVRRLVKPQDAAHCNILYISISEESRLGSVLSAVQHFSPLTVSDIPDFATHGGMIEFIAQQGKIRFEVNRFAAEQSHVTLSSELLKVAVKVIDSANPQSQP